MVAAQNAGAYKLQSEYRQALEMLASPAQQV
jgi:hypothetical protein